MYLLYFCVLCYSNSNLDVIEVLDDEDEILRDLRLAQEAADREMAIQLDRQEYSDHFAALDRAGIFPHLNAVERLDAMAREEIDRIYEINGIEGERDYGWHGPHPEDVRRMADAVRMSMDDADLHWPTAISLGYPEL